MEKGQNAYVSFIRAYKEHHCNFIFILKNLPLNTIAMSFGLLYMPKLPDIKYITQQDYPLFINCTIKADLITFKDKQREHIRQLNIKSIKNKNKNEKNSRIINKKKKYNELKKKKNKKRSKGKKIHEEMMQEWDELAYERRLLKKLKKGKITQQQYDQLFL